MKFTSISTRVIVGGTFMVMSLATPITVNALAAGGPHTSRYALQTVRDANDGFTIGVPTGWNLSTLGAGVVASKDASGHEVSLVYPAVLTSGLKPSTYFTSYLGYLKRDLGGGGSFTYTMISNSGQLPAASVTIHANGTTLVGRATTAITPDHTAHGSSMIAVHVYWAPQGQLGGQQPELAAIGNSFAPQQANMYHVFHVQGDPYTFLMPPGWKDAGENQDQLLLQNANNTASVLYWLGITQSSNAGSAAGLLALMFKNLGISVTKVLSLDRLPNQNEPNGHIQSTQYEEFLAIYQGASLHGIVSVVADTGGGVTSGVMRLGISTPGLWNSINGALIHMAGSIQHDFTQDIQTWEHITQQWQLEGQTFQEFDNAITGADLEANPATGETFEAPYNSFQASGPSGPGYYQGSTKLQPTTSF